MNPNIQRLYNIARKESRLIVGLMSGTSLDGLDIALCRFRGNGKGTTVELLQFETKTYSEDTKNKIRRLFAKEQVDLNFLCLFNEWLGNQHAEMVLESLCKWEIESHEVDLIGSHGQTIMHSPKSQHPNDEFGNGTLQIGDGDHIAVKTGIITLSDFRQKHVAVGGEGAPLAVFCDFLLFSDELESRILLNIGGIGNFTYLPSKSEKAAVLVSDTGPGNTIMDAYMQRHWKVAYDDAGRFASKGKVIEPLLRALLDDPFFQLPLPRSTGPEYFNLRYLEAAQQRSHTVGADNADVMATLNQLTARSITDAIQKVAVEQHCPIYISGGGWHNQLLIDSLKSLLKGYKICDFSDLGIPGDAKEAVLFAALANESVSGSPQDYPVGMLLPVSTGKVSFPG